MGVSSALLLSLKLQTPLVVSSHLRLLALLETTIPTGVSLSRKVTTVKRQRDATRRDLAAATSELRKMEDDKDELRSSFIALRDAIRCRPRRLWALCRSPTVSSADGHRQMTVTRSGRDLLLCRFVFVDSSVSECSR